MAQVLKIKLKFYGCKPAWKDFHLVRKLVGFPYSNNC